RMIKEQTIRLQRHVEDNEVKTIGFDTRVPNEPFDQIEVFLWNPGSNKAVWADDLKVEGFH
ncbi:MAG: hypothetical protein JNN28_03210, partial [Saprospiraceae bacterium]|nr:hypothetical protein [Saprospiraceae bacterium]